MEPFLPVVKAVTDASESINASITDQNPDIAALLASDACQRCKEFLTREAPDIHRRESDEFSRFRAGRLMFVLATLQSPDDYVRKELLCLQGTRGVDAYGALRAERRRKAAAARRKPLRDMPWYVEHHLPRAQRRLAGELSALVEHRQLLVDFLDLNGAYAMAHHP